LRTQRSFEINEIEATDSIRDVHLVQGVDRFALEVRGKTGEPRARQAVQVWLKHREFRRPAEATLQTDGEGRIELGRLPDIVSLQASVAGTPTREWSLPVGESTQARSIHSPAGEVIVIPVPQTPVADTAAAYTLFEMRGGTFVSDQSERIQLADGALTLADLPPGNYQLYHKTTGNLIHVRITDGDVISSFALGRDRFLEMRSIDAPYIRDHEITEQSIRLQLAGDLSDARIHVFAARQTPRFRTQEIISAVRDAEPQMVKPSADQSVYIAGRDIGDEYRYILDRKFAPHYAGNMLDRPSLLLSPWATRTTDTTVQVAAEGEDFSAAGGGLDGEAQRSGEVAHSESMTADPASLDFLQDPSVILSNLRPDDNGVVTIDRAALGPKTQLQIVLVGNLATQSLPVALPEVELATRDLRLASAIDPERHFAQAKQVTILPADKELTIDDVGSARLQAIDDLGDVYRVFAAISQDATLAEFNFIVEWSSKSDKEKRELYSKYACHELNFFLSKKDPAFYEAVVRPFLASKRSKTFVDQWLLEQPVEAYFDPWEFGRLNVAERILLSQVSAERRAMLSRHIRELYELAPTPRRAFDRLYDLSLKSNSLDASETAVRFAEAGEKLAKTANEPAPAAPALADGAAAPGDAVGGFGGGAPQGAARGEAARPESAGRRNDRFGLDDKKAEGKEMDRADATKDELEESLNSRLGVAARERQNRDQFEAKQLLERQLEMRKQVAQLYRRIDQTSEWIENNYYHIPADQQSPQLVTVNRFWRDYVEHPDGEPFLSPYFAEAAGSFTQMMFALAVIDLPFEADEHTFDFADNTLKIVPKSPIIVLHQQVQPAVLDPREANLLIGENYFRVDDRYRQVGDQRYDKFIVDEFVTHVLYGAQVVVTNPTSTPQPIDLLMQIPQGAIPANNSHVTRAIQLDMQPFSTQTVEYFFYFPRSGQFQHYPAHVALDQRTIAFANPLAFNVVDQPTRIDKSSWAYISQNGSDDEVIEFLRRENVQGLDLSKIAFRMRDAAFFETAVEVLRDRLAYNWVLWSYGILHNNVDAIKEFLTGQEDFARHVGFAIDSPLLTVDPVTRRWYEHREYWPLANARTYRLGPQRQITNDVIRGQYQQLLGYLSCRREFSADDRMALVYYLLLQDRIDEAVGFFKQIQPGSVSTPLQYDYLSTYLAMSLEELDQAEQIAVTRKEFPVDRWRKMFENVLAQVREARGGSPDPSDPLNRDQQQAALAAKAPNFEFDVEAQKVTLRYQNLSEITVNYYRMDLELLFSRNPFVQQGSTGFSLIRPNVTQTVKLPADKVQASFDLPAEFLNSNVLVEIVGSGQTKSTAYYANSLAVQISETYGQLKVAHQGDGKPVSKAYVKVYARMKDGSVAFYKDGYTDSRGRFDYSSLSNQSIGDVDRFALLVLSDQNGAMVREAATPKE
jgi:hypothetical protein